jgi:hypothetical protein
VEAEAASRRRALRGAGGAHLGQQETAASAAKANASIVELETLATTDENQGWPATLLMEFGAFSDDGSVAEVSLRG